MKLNFINERIISAALAVSGLTIFTLIGFGYEVFHQITQMICMIMVNVGLKNYFKGRKWGERSFGEKITILAVVVLIVSVILLVKYYA